MLDFQEPSPGKRTLDLTPMIDVVFLLLIFFMLTSIYAKPVLPLDLPEAESCVQQRNKEIVIGIAGDGGLTLNRSRVALDELESLLAQELDGQPEEKSVCLAADKNVSFGRAIRVMDTAKKAGARNISIIIREKNRRDR